MIIKDSLHLTIYFYIFQTLVDIFKLFSNTIYGLKIIFFSIEHYPLTDKCVQYHII